MFIFRRRKTWYIINKTCTSAEKTTVQEKYNNHKLFFVATFTPCCRRIIHSYLLPLLIILFQIISIHSFVDLSFLLPPSTFIQHISPWLLHYYFFSQRLYKNIQKLKKIRYENLELREYVNGSVIVWNSIYYRLCGQQQVVNGKNQVKHHAWNNRSFRELQFRQCSIIKQHSRWKPHRTFRAGINLPEKRIITLHRDIFIFFFYITVSSVSLKTH